MKNDLHEVIRASILTFLEPNVKRENCNQLIIDLYQQLTFFQVYTLRLKESLTFQINFLDGNDDPKLLEIFMKDMLRAEIRCDSVFALNLFFNRISVLMTRSYETYPNVQYESQTKFYFTTIMAVISKKYNKFSGETNVLSKYIDKKPV